MHTWFSCKIPLGPCIDFCKWGFSVFIMLRGVLCGLEPCSAFRLLLPLAEVQSLSSYHSGRAGSSVRARYLSNISRTYHLLANSSSTGLVGNSPRPARNADFVERTFRGKLISFKGALRPYSKMSTSLVLRLLASSVRIADRAGNIVRDIMSKGDLQIVDKVISAVFYRYVDLFSTFLCGC